MAEDPAPPSQEMLSALPPGHEIAYENGEYLAVPTSAPQGFFGSLRKGAAEVWTPTATGADIVGTAGKFYGGSMGEKVGRGIGYAAGVPLAFLKGGAMAGGAVGGRVGRGVGQILTGLPPPDTAPEGAYMGEPLREPGQQPSEESKQAAIEALGRTGELVGEWYGGGLAGKALGGILGLAGHGLKAMSKDVPFTEIGQKGTRSEDWVKNAKLAYEEEKAGWSAEQAAAKETEARIVAEQQAALDHAHQQALETRLYELAPGMNMPPERVARGTTGLAVRGKLPEARDAAQALSMHNFATLDTLGNQSAKGMDVLTETIRERARQTFLWVAEHDPATLTTANGRALIKAAGGGESLMADLGMTAPIPRFALQEVAGTKPGPLTFSEARELAGYVSNAAKGAGTQARAMGEFAGSIKDGLRASIKDSKATAEAWDDATQSYRDSIRPFLDWADEFRNKSGTEIFGDLAAKVRDGKVEALGANFKYLGDDLRQRFAEGYLVQKIESAREVNGAINMKTLSKLLWGTEKERVGQRAIYGDRAAEALHAIAGEAGTPAGRALGSYRFPEKPPPTWANELPLPDKAEPSQIRTNLLRILNFTAAYRLAAKAGIGLGGRMVIGAAAGAAAKKLDAAFTAKVLLHPEIAEMALKGGELAGDNLQSLQRIMGTILAEMPPPQPAQGELAVPTRQFPWDH